MRSLNVALDERAYDIHIGRGLLDRGDLFATALRRKRAVVISNEIVAPLYAARVLGRAGFGRCRPPVGRVA
jgi:3-dehydroquinate synthetase